jgi:hypothetical protein
MNLTIVTSRPIFEQALQAARQLGKGSEFKGLNAPTDAIRAYLEEAWDLIHDGLKSAYEFGRDRVQGLLDAAVVKTEELLRRAGSNARDLHTALLERLQLFMRNLIQGTMRLFPTEYTIGDQAFRMSGMKCTQKVLVTGSIKMSLTEAFSLVSTGEIAIEAQYEGPRAGV